MKKRLVGPLVLGLLWLSALGCAASRTGVQGVPVRFTLIPSMTPFGSATPTTPAPSVTPWLAATDTASPTDTVSPTDTASPADTAQPTEAATPTDTASPADTAIPPTSPPPTETPVPPTATAVPPTPVVPTATPESLGIVSFQADPTEVDPGDTITLNWEARGAVQVIVYHLLQSGQYGDFWEVDPTGSMAYAIADSVRYDERFQLFVKDAADQHVAQDLTVVVRCPDTWFFSGGVDECPISPAMVTDGAEEHFEHGLMLWNLAEGRIYVLFSDGNYPKWKAYADSWHEGDPVSDPGIVPPSGLYQPVRGFGKVWREQSGVRDRLGWATGEEQGYQTHVQWTARFKYNMVYIADADGGVWELGPEGGAWRYIAQ